MQPPGDLDQGVGNSKRARRQVDVRTTKPIASPMRSVAQAIVSTID
jgi:hypothetical protein